MTTLEKAAKAKFENARARTEQNSLIFGPETRWEELPAWAQKECTDQVRATFDTLRKSPGCVSRVAVRDVFGEIEFDFEIASETWSAMIDAILNEKDT